MSTKTSIKRIALVAVSALGFGLLSAMPSQAANPGNVPEVPFELSASTGTLVADSYISAAKNYSAVVTQTAGTGNFVTINAIIDGPSGASYSFATSGVGAISLPTSASASWVFQPETGTATSGSLAGSTLSATGSTGRVFLASTVTGSVATPSTAVVNLATLYGVNGATATAGNYAPWGSGNNAIVYTVSGVGTLRVALGGFANSLGWVNASFRVTVPSAGLTTLSITELTTSGGVVTSTVRESFSITGIGAAPSNSYSFTTVSADAGASNGYEPVAGRTIYAPASDITNAAAVISYQAVGTTGANITNPLLQPELTVTITGVGSLSASGTSSQYTKVTEKTWTSGTINIFSDGRAGTATVTVRAGDVVVGTTNVSFYGKVAKVSVSPIYTIGYADGAGATTGSVDDTTASANISKLGTNFFTPTINNDPALAIIATDAAGNTVPVGAGSYSVTNSNTLAFSSSLTGGNGGRLDSGIGLYTAGFGTLHATFGTTAYAKSGDKGSLTLAFTNTDGTVVTSNTVNLTAGGKPNTVTVTPDKSEYKPGERGYFLTQVKDASGNPTADGVLWSNFYSATPIVSGAFTWTTSVAAGAGGTVAAYGKAHFTVGGEWKSYFFAPIASGDYSVTATTGSDFSTAGQGVKLTIPVKVSADAGSTAATAAANAAADAAAEAIDAANAATDAANLAAEAADAATVAAEEARDAADAATAAVEELATQVATLMAALKAQITTLANTVAKIAKRVRA